MGTDKGIDLAESNFQQTFLHSFVVVNYVLYQNSSIFKLVSGSFNEDIADVGIGYLFFGDLDFTATAQLELSDGLATFSNY